MRRLILVWVGIAAFAGSASAQPPPQDGLGPRKLGQAQVMCTDLPLLMSPEVTLRIVGGNDGHKRVSHAKGDWVVLPGGTSNNLAIGQRFVARRVQTAPYSESIRRAGYIAVRTAGVVTVIGADERFAIARVDFGCDEILTGDYLEPFTESAQMPYPIDGGSVDWDDRARVMFGTDRREEFADGDIFNFDRGSEHGIVNGARVVVYRDRFNGLPLVELGHAVVVEVAQTTSKAVLIKLSHDHVHAGDVVVRWK